jgi:hypothetical protein
MGVQIRVMGDDREEVALSMHVLVAALRASGNAAVISNNMMIPNRQGPGGRMTASMEVSPGYTPGSPIEYETRPPRQARTERDDRHRRGGAR